MLIAELIRLGRPLVVGGLTVTDTLKIITDVTDVRTRNFYRHVIVAELPEGDNTRPEAWVMNLVSDMETDEGKPQARLDEARAVGIPFSLPSGGNPLNPQGRYGLPVYPCWEPHLDGFRESAERVREFLEGRLERSGLVLPARHLEALCERIHEVVQTEIVKSKEKCLGVLVLAQCSEVGPYRYGQRRGSPSNLGKSRFAPGHFVEPNLERILEAVWKARLDEGAEMGVRAEGLCTVSGQVGRVLSAYCKAWPWAFPTWTCPVPHGGNTEALIEGMSLSAESYRALTMGASVFGRLTRKVRAFIIQEVFSPTADGKGRDIAHKRSVRDLASIYGAAFVLPVEDRLLHDEDFKAVFAARVLNQLHPEQFTGIQAERQLAAVTGFDCFVPAELSGEDFRLTLVYFSGDPSRGDIHLRAFIQDVVPSTASRLRDEALNAGQAGREMLRGARIGDKRAAYLFDRYRSVPYLLARGYGGPHLWSQLERVLHGGRLESGRITANAAARMSSLVPNFPASRYDLAEEAVFHLCCLEFIRNWNSRLSAALEGVKDMQQGNPSRPWKELVHAFEREPVDQMNFHTAGELGFASGLLLRQFNAWYAAVLGRGKDYLKERVLTFGANLSPRDVWLRGVKGVRDTAGKHDKLRRAVELGQLGYYETKEEKQAHRGDYARRLGVVLSELERSGPQLEKNRDEFMTGFWAGYSLHGYDRPATVMAHSQSPATKK